MQEKSSQRKPRETYKSTMGKFGYFSVLLLDYEDILAPFLFLQVQVLEALIEE